MNKPSAADLDRRRKQWCERAPIALQAGMTLGGAFAFTVVSLLTPCLLLCLQAACTTHSSTASELQLLQGYWEGDGAAGECSVTITGNSLHFYVRKDFWYETTFALPAGTDPQQLHATITDCSPPKDGIGEVVFAIFKIEDGLLTLAVDDTSDEPPETFADARSHYNLTRVEPREKQAEPTKPK